MWQILFLILFFGLHKDSYSSRCTKYYSSIIYWTSKPINLTPFSLCFDYRKWQQMLVYILFGQFVVHVGHSLASRWDTHWPLVCIVACVSHVFARAHPMPPLVCTPILHPLHTSTSVGGYAWPRAWGTMGVMWTNGFCSGL